MSVNAARALLPRCFDVVLTREKVRRCTHSGLCNLRAGYLISSRTFSGAEGMRFLQVIIGILKTNQCMSWKYFLCTLSPFLATQPIACPTTHHFTFLRVLYMAALSRLSYSARFLSYGLPNSLPHRDTFRRVKHIAHQGEARVLWSFVIRWSMFSGAHPDFDTSIFARVRARAWPFCARVDLTTQSLCETVFHPCSF